MFHIGNTGGSFGLAENISSGTIPTGGNIHVRESYHAHSSQSSSGPGLTTVSTNLPSLGSKIHELETIAHSKLPGFDTLQTHSTLGSGLTGSSNIHGFETHSTTAPGLVGVAKYEEVHYSSNVPKWETETIKTTTIPATAFESSSFSSKSSHGFDTIHHSSNLPSLGSKIHEFESISHGTKLPSLGSGLVGSSNIHGFETHSSTAPGLVGVAKYEEVRYSSNVPKWETETIKTTTIPAAAAFESSSSETISARSSHGFGTIHSSLGGSGGQSFEVTTSSPKILGTRTDIIF